MVPNICSPKGIALPRGTFPRARSAVKYLVADGRYDYIETGSLISIRENVKDILIPSEEDRMNLYPMDFEEFLWASGNETMMPLIQSCFEKRKPLGQALHRKAMDLFRQYMIIGGMPQAIETYVSSHDFDLADQVKRRILNLHRDDIRRKRDHVSAGIHGAFTLVFLIP